MNRIVIFSDCAETLKAEQAAAQRAGVRAQLRDLRAYIPGWKPDGQFRNAQAVVKLSKGASDRVKERAAEIKQVYGELGVKFHSSISTMLKSMPEEAAESPVVEGVDTPGPGTVEDMKGVTNKREK
jgi:hypothetical protein